MRMMARGGGSQWQIDSEQAIGDVGEEERLAEVHLLEDELQPFA